MDRMLSLTCQIHAFCSIYVFHGVCIVLVKVFGCSHDSDNQCTWRACHNQPITFETLKAVYCCISWHIVRYQQSNVAGIEYCDTLLGAPP